MEVSPMRVIVDAGLCQGHAQCEDAAPEVFEVGDDALSHLRIQAPPEQLRGQVEDAARRCPTEAIRIEDD
jgi:ferredoxin